MFFAKPEVIYDRKYNILCDSDVCEHKYLPRV